jgi:hypothetical protein
MGLSRGSLRLMVTMLEILLALPLSARVARACSCLEPGAPCAATWSVDAVFIGRASERQPGTTPGPTRFVVEHAVRGVSDADVIEVEDGPGTCAVSFIAGQQYVVYAYRDKTSRRFATSLCTRTHVIGSARPGEVDEDLAYFDELRRPAASARLTGSVMERVERAATAGLVSRPLAGIVLTARAISPPGQSRTARTRGDGTYEIAGLGIGLFEVSVDLPPAYEPSTVTQRVAIVDPHACPVANFTARRRPAP